MKLLVTYVSANLILFLNTPVAAGQYKWLIPQHVSFIKDILGTKMQTCLV